MKTAKVFSWRFLKYINKYRGAQGWTLGGDGVKMRKTPLPTALSPSHLRSVRTKSIPCVKRPLVRTGQGEIQRGAHEGAWCAQNRPRAHGINYSDQPRAHGERVCEG